MMHKAKYRASAGTEWSGVACDGVNERRISGGGIDGSAEPSIGTVMRGSRDNNAASSLEYAGEWKIEVKLDTAMNAPTKTSRMIANRVSGDDEQRDMTVVDEV
jgi:hypothetical protein